MNLVFQEALVTAVSNRGENHGEDIVPAVSLKFTCACPLGILAELKPAPSLKDWLFTDEKQPIVRMAEVGEISWKPEYENATAKLVGITMTGVEFKKIRIEPNPEGTVTISGSLNMQPADEETHGTLARLVKQTIKISLTKLTQKTIEEAEEEDDDKQPDLPGTSVLTQDGALIQPLQH